jgi:5,6-dimethylbenzimidazole synthase
MSAARRKESGMTAAPVFDEAFRARLLDLLLWRRDVRHFRATKPPPSVIDHLLEVASLAPSVGLSQPWRFVTVDAPERRAAVRANFESCNALALTRQRAEFTPQYAQLKLAGLDEAPCHIAVFAVPDPDQGHGLGRDTMPETTAYSAVMAIHTLWLVARAHGLGLGWVSILRPDTLKTSLDVPAEWTFIGYVCVGYPKSEDDIPELERAGWEYRRAAAAAHIRR